MALTKEEKEFLSSIEGKILQYEIKVSLDDCINIMNGIQAYTQYNDNSVELVDTAIEIFLIKNSFSYFINKYGKVDIPGLGTVPMDPYYFQSEMAKEIDNYRKIVLDKTRQCLTKDNYVMTKRGYISIKDVKPGDMIETLIGGKPSFVLVEDFFPQGKKEICRVTLVDGKKISCTLDHQVLTKDGWRESRDLSLKDKVVTINGLKNISSIILEGFEEVYDITTSSNDFLANGIMVHNCGMSTIFALYAFWKAHFFEAESIDVVSTKQTKAQQFVKKIYSTMESLPEWMRTPVKSQNQQRVVFQHSSGSTSEILSESQSENAGRGDSLSVLILDEVAFYQSERMVRQIVASAQPTLNKTGGKIILISCVTKDTYIFTNKGLQQVEDFIPIGCKPGFNEIPEFNIDGINHQQKSNTFYDSGITPTRKLYLQNGNKNEISEIHPFYIIDETSVFPYFKQSKDIKIGDYALASCREKTFGNNNKLVFSYTPRRTTGPKKDKNIKNFNNEITKEMAYFFGLLIGDGSIEWSKKNGYVIITSSDEEVQEWLLNNPHFECYRESREKDDIHFRLQGRYLVNLLKKVGFKKQKAKNKIIPKKLLQMSKENLSYLLRGLFDADGHSRTRDGTVGFTSTSKELLNQVKLLLDMFGIQISDERWNVIGPSKIVKVSSYVGQITLSKYFSKLFYEKIGFLIERKQEKYEMVKKMSYSKSQSYPNLGVWIKKNLIEKNVNEKLKQSLGKNSKKGLTPPSRIIRGRDITRETLRKILEYYDGVLNHTKEYKKLKDFYDKDWYLLQIKDIKKGKAHTYDFTIPETKSFYANGVISQNTPNGVSGKGAYYYEQVVAARSGERGTKYIGIDWWEIPDDPRIQGPKKGYNDILEKAIKENYYYKPNIKDKYKKYFDPIAREAYNDNEWLRASFQDLGDSTYRQEILHDFVIAGDKVFNEDILKKVEERIKEPIRINKLGTEQVEGWWVWKDPIPGHRYLISSDVSSGTSGDYSSIQVIDVGEYEQAAEYKGFISTPNLSRLIKKIARYYNEGYIIIESNGIGESVFNGVYYSENDPYNNIYKQKKVKNGVTRFTGWITDVKSRKLIINDFIDWITVDDLWDQLKIYSKRLWLEMNTFIWTGGGRANHADGANDDTIISFAIGMYNRNKAVLSGESFLINDDGSTISIDDDFSDVEVSSKKGFNIVTTDDETDDEEYRERYGVDKEEYKWLLDL